MILFLDIDGVLHPLPDPGRSGEEQFTRLELLEEVLRQLPHVEVVISSSWRELHPLEDIRTYFSHDVQARIVDVTPLRVAASEVPADVREFVRHSECLAWLRRRRPAGTPWLAIDDVADLWAPDCENLLLIDGSTGLTSDSAQVLLQRLREGRG